MVTTNRQGEIADFQEADQFQPARSQFMCGYYACAIAKSMAPVGKPPTLSVQQIINDAHTWYQHYAGDDTTTNTNGMTLSQEYDLLRYIGLQYQPIEMTINAIKQSINDGCPVIIAVYETSVYDLALGDVSPYPWIASGSHIILVTGIALDGNLLVRDSANCTSLLDPNSLRPGPRKYDADKIRMVSATKIIPPWMQGSEVEEVLSIQQASQFFTEVVKDEVWQCKQNGHRISHGILQYYRACTNKDLNGVSQYGLPIGEEEGVPNATGCTLQRFERGVICWDSSGKLDHVPGITGPCYPAHIDKGPGRDPAVLQLMNDNKTLLDKIAQLEKQVVLLKVPPTISTDKQ